VTVGELASRVGARERRYLNDTFAELCRIESPSGQERACADRVIAELRALGVDVHEDDAGELAGSSAGNLLARIPAEPRSGAEGGPAIEGSPSSEAVEGAPGAEDRSRIGRPSVLLCAHLDTPALTAPVEPVLADGVWENAEGGSLGADSRAAVAVLLALARHVCREGSPVDVELLFTVCQRTALAGAHAFDVSRLRSEIGYVFDHSSPIGEVIVESPSHFRVEASFHGVVAQAGVRAEQGRSAILAAARAVSAMRLGRLDAETTVNLGAICGGGAVDLVPERCTLVAEVRSLSDERAEAVAAELIDRVHEAANLPDCDCDVDVSVRRTFSGYRLPSAAPAVQAAERALRACGHEPARISSGGASTANALRARGFETVNLANGTEPNHEPGERVSAAALEGMLDVALALLDEVEASSLDVSR
jgi:tripeptide aminopeptidase